MLVWPEYTSEEQKERERVEWVFGLTGGELEDEYFAGYQYNYKGVPEYAGSDFPDKDKLDVEYRTAIVTGGGFLPYPDDHLEHEGITYKLVQSYRSSGEVDCPICGADGNGVDWWAAEFENYHGFAPRPDDECSLCETAYQDMPGLIYIGEGYEAVYRRGEAMEDLDDQDAELLYRYSGYRGADVPTGILEYTDSDVAVWDARVAAHINYTDAYGGAAEPLEFMAEEICPADFESAEDIILQLDLDVDPPVVGEDILEVWDDIISALVKAGYKTWYSTKLPGGGYNLGVLDDTFGFIFSADDDDLDAIRGQSFDPDDGWD